jgi:hypothetical protein
MSTDIDRGLAEGWISLPTDNPQPDDGIDIHVGKYWRSRFGFGGGGGTSTATSGGHVADGGSYGGGETSG